MTLWIRIRILIRIELNFWIRIRIRIESIRIHNPGFKHLLIPIFLQKCTSIQAKKSDRYRNFKMQIFLKFNYRLVIEHVCVQYSTGFDFIEFASTGSVL
jgi:hypothetical protein